MNQHCHVVCHPLYTVYFTPEKKDHLAVLEVLRNGAPCVCRLNASAYAWLEPFKLPAALVAQLHTFPQEQDLTQRSLSVI